MVRERGKELIFILTLFFSLCHSNFEPYVLVISNIDIFEIPSSLAVFED